MNIDVVGPTFRTQPSNSTLQEENVILLLFFPPQLLFSSIEQEHGENPLFILNLNGLIHLNFSLLGISIHPTSLFTSELVVSIDSELQNLQ